MAKIGIDISEHQGDIKLEVLKNQIDFVIIRVGYGTKGSIDNKFKRNVELCSKIGLPYGFYWYSYALDTKGAKKEARAFLEAIKPYSPTYGCWFDMEDADNYKKNSGMPLNDVLQDICYEFCSSVEEAGYYSGIYASESWFNNQLKSEKLNRFDKWVAQWPTHGRKQKGMSVKPEDRSDLHLWQFTSQGTIKGYNGNLDVNYAYVDFPNPNNNNDKPTPTPTPNKKHEIGDRVVINGALYKSSNDNSPAGTVNNKITNITRYAEGALHPYNTTGDLGWIDEASISAYTSDKGEIQKGSTIRFLGTHSYSGIKLADWVTNDIFNVIELSGDRAVIGKGTAVTAAVNIKDCRLI